jgi:23S rRNA pseudouridine955/2504/2580 synthase/23S rRNA pseudouridine1911/1915/1917 synthase
MERKPFAKLSRADSGSRLVDWLSSRFTYLSAEAWLCMLGEGRVSVDGLSARADRILAAGEIVAFDPPPFEEPEVDASFAVVMEDEDFLIVDKSGNLPCHPGGRYFEHSLWYLLRERYGEIRIATRLDRETSGLVLACKSAASASFAQRMLAEGALEKEYLAMVHGRFPEYLDARGYLTEDRASAVRKKRRYADGKDIPEGKKVEACATSFGRVGFIDSRTADRAYGGISLVRARPITGRTHQIRATLRSLGFPVVGDKLYGLDEGFFLRFAEGSLNEEDLTRLILPNQALHCAELSFRGRAGRVVSVRSEPRWGSPYRELAAQVPWRT